MIPARSHTSFISTKISSSYSTLVRSLKPGSSPELTVWDTEWNRKYMEIAREKPLPLAGLLISFQVGMKLWSKYFPGSEASSRGEENPGCIHFYLLWCSEIPFGSTYYSLFVEISGAGDGTGWPSWIKYMKAWRQSPQGPKRIKDLDGSCVYLPAVGCNQRCWLAVDNTCKAKHVSFRSLRKFYVVWMSRWPISRTIFRPYLE